MELIDMIVALQQRNSAMFNLVLLMVCEENIHYQTSLKKKRKAPVLVNPL